MKIRSDSLYARLKKRSLLDAFFGMVATEAPGYDEMLAWCESHGETTSIGALHNLVTYHMGRWRVEQAVASANEAVAELPADADDIVRERLHGLRLDLALRDLSEKQAMALLKLDLAERELQAKTASARDVAVQALLMEANGRPNAEALLKEFLAALEDAPE